ncbi:MAG: MATE family efflux transporter, partial [Pseudomonadales bacterium]
HPWALGPLISLLSDTSGELSVLAFEYTSIRIWAAPAALLTYVFVGWLIGIQDTRSVMWILVLTNLLNIIFDYVLIVNLGLASAGAAWASLAAEYLGCALGAILVTRKLCGLNISIKLPKIDWQSLGEMFHSSRHLFVRTLCLLFTFLFFTSQGALIGSETAAANAILLNLLALTAFTMDGFAHAAEALCGKAWGAKDRFEFLDACKKTSVLAAIMAILCSAILFIGQQTILTIYTDLEAVRQIALEDYLWLALLPLVAVWCYQLDGIFIGIGHSQTMQNAMLLATLGVFIPAWWFSQHLGNTGLWLTMFSFHIARIAGLALPFFRIIRQDMEKG